MIPLAAILLTAAAAPDLTIEVERVDGDRVCNISAKDVFPSHLLAALAVRLDRRLVGLDAVELGKHISIDLRDRPVDQALTYILGTCGLRGRLTSTTIEVQSEVAGDAPVEEIESAAELAYMRALRSFPHSFEAPASEFAIAKIQERRGNLTAAQAHYDLIVQEHSTSELVPYALLRSGMLLQELGNPSDAWTEFSSLLNLDREHPYGVQARLALARLSVELGDPQRGLYVMDALDNVQPATEPADLAERLRIRALCFEKLDAPMDSLRLIDQAERIEGETPESLELRALALETSDRGGEAVRAWMTLSERAPEERLGHIFGNAARLAYELGDDMGVLFIHRQAESYGAESKAQLWAVRSRERLGLPSMSLNDSTTESQLAYAESLWRDGFAEQALDAARPLITLGATRNEEQYMRALVLYARAADASGRLDDAISTLRLALVTINVPDNRGVIYSLAGELYELHGRFEDAINAYEGRL